MKDLFLGDVPLLDVRAPVEFNKGAFPMAENLPILNDAERESVGISYRQDGPGAARQLGHRLVSGPIRAGRISGWRHFIKTHPGTRLYCFRGGLRSRIAAEWLAAEGLQVPRIEGGYKAMRRFLLESLASLPDKLPLVVVSGKTGCGKTAFLMRQSGFLDLEAAANHRGSAFGKLPSPQPCQVDFEHTIAVNLLKLENGKFTWIFLEDESRTIGRVSIPDRLFAAMGSVPVILLEDDLDNRVERIFKEYIIEHLDSCQHSNIEYKALDRLEVSMLDSLRAISRRLGGVSSDEISRLMAGAFARHRRGDPGDHRLWIAELLRRYYDPMYDYQIEKKLNRIIARGKAGELHDEVRSDSMIKRKQHSDRNPAT